MTELKKCPFCGGEARIESGVLDEFVFRCAACGLRASFFRRKAADRTEEKAIEAWNRRSRPMSYIERKTLIEKLRGCKVNVTSILSEEDTIAAAIDDGIDTAISVLSTMPDADVEPIRHGEWIKKESETTYWFECSECGEEPLRDGYGQRAFSRNCPSCGALMDKGET